MSDLTSPDALLVNLIGASQPITDETEGVPFAIVPSTSSFPTFRSTSSLTPLVCDERVIARLLETLISRSGMSLGLVAEKLGVTPNAVRQYLKGRRNKPSLLWFVRLVEVCGGKVSMEFPKR